MSPRTIALSLALFGATLGGSFLGCDDHGSSPAECEAISERCHHFDTGSGPAHDCHDYAHHDGRTAAECLARQPACFAACVAADGGASD